MTCRWRWQICRKLFSREVIFINVRNVIKQFISLFISALTTLRQFNFFNRNLLTFRHLQLLISLDLIFCIDNITLISFLRLTFEFVSLSSSAALFFSIIDKSFSSFFCSFSFLFSLDSNSAFFSFSVSTFFDFKYSTCELSLDFRDLFCDDSSFSSSSRTRLKFCNLMTLLFSWVNFADVIDSRARRCLAFWSFMWRRSIQSLFNISLLESRLVWFFLSLVMIICIIIFVASWKSYFSVTVAKLSR